MAVTMIQAYAFYPNWKKKIALKDTAIKEWRAEG
jgi:hypothetical protein